MSTKRLRPLIIAVSLAAATAALAAGLEGLEYQKSHTVKMKSGKEVTVMAAMMNGRMMAVIPMEDLEDLFQRAEGHSMVTAP